MAHTTRTSRATKGADAARRAGGVVTAAALLLGISGCVPSRGSEERPEPSETAWESSAPSPTPTGERLSDLDVQVLLSTSTPKKLTWLVSDPPSDWKALDAETGVMQWQVADSACAFTLVGGLGYGTDAEPGSREVAESIATSIAFRPAGVEPQFTPESSESVSARILADGQHADLRIGFASSRLTASAEPLGGTGTVDGFTMGFRDHSDDVGVLFAVCGDGDLAEHEPAMRDFISNRLAVELTY